MSIAVEIVRNLISLADSSKFKASSFAFFLVKAILYFIVMCGVYLLMLALMTYSTGVFAAITSGNALGYMMFHAFAPSLQSSQNYSTSLQLLNI